MDPRKIDLNEVMQSMPFERELVVAARKQDVNAMLLRFKAGACVATIANVLHYRPEVLPSVLEAVGKLETEQREFNTAVLWEIGLRLRGDQMRSIRSWHFAHEAVRAIELSGLTTTCTETQVPQTVRP